MICYILYGMNDNVYIIKLVLQEKKKKLLWAAKPKLYIKSKGIYQPENLMSNGSSKHDDAAQTK